MLEEAKKLHGQGFSVCFTKDPSKPGGKAPIGYWRDFIDGEQTAKDIQKMYDYAKTKEDNLGLAVICTKGIEVLDVDVKYFLDDKHYVSDVFDAIVDAVGLETYEKLIEAKTISDGYHLMYRTNIVEGSQKLASRATIDSEKKNPNDNVRVLLETRSYGGIFVVSPSGGYVYDNPNRTIENISLISDSQRNSLIQVCRGFNEIEDRSKNEQRVIKPIEVVGESKSTIEAFKDSTTCEEILESIGWEYSHTRGKYKYFVRPGKSIKEGISASVNIETGNFYNWSSSTELPSAIHMDSIDLYSFLNHNDDFKETCRELYKLGFGDRKKKTTHSEKVKLITTIDKTMIKGVDDTSYLDSIFNERIDITVKEVQKPNTLYIRDDKKGKYIGLGGYGDIVNIFGAGKSKKTGIAIAAASCFVKGGSGQSLLFKGECDGKKIIHFDTEQSRHYTQVAAKEIVHQAGLPPTAHPDNFMCFPIKKLTKIDRLNFIKHVIFNKVDNIGCILLDGVVDVCRNYNDLEEASDLVTFLLNTAETAKFLLLDILHTAQSTGKAKGHLGQELINKATANLSVVAEEDSEFSSFKVTSKRGEFTDASFDFWYNKQGHIDLY